MEILELLKSLVVFAGYLTGHSTFPKPLSPKEEAEYVEKMMHGDENAKNKLIECNLRLVAHIAKKYSNINTDKEDIISIGTIGLIKGVGSFSPQKGQLTTYISKCIENEILMFVRATKKQKAEVSLNDSVGLDKDGGAIALMDILCTEEDDVADTIQVKMQVEKLLKVLKYTLNERENVVIELRYGLNGSDVYTQREIAEKLGISRSYVSRIEKKALEKLNRVLK